MKQHNYNILGIDVRSILSILQNSPYFSWIILIFLVGFISGSRIKKPELNIHTQPPTFSRAEYERLKTNMPLVEVEAILGRGTEIQQSIEMTTFVWTNSDGSKITATFKGGKLQTKENAGL